MPDPSPTRIRITEERRRELLRRLGEFYAQTFDERLSVFRADQLLDFFVSVLGPPVYNQAIQDARAFMLDKLDDLDAEFYTREAPG